jgi:hypothetical protein
MRIYLLVFIRFCQRYPWSILNLRQTRARLGMQLDKADVDVDLGVVGIGRTLVVDFEVSSIGAFAA